MGRVSRPSSPSRCCVPVSRPRTLLGRRSPCSSSTLGGSRAPRRWRGQWCRLRLSCSAQHFPWPSHRLLNHHRIIAACSRVEYGVEVLRDPVGSPITRRSCPGIRQGRRDRHCQETKNACSHKTMFPNPPAEAITISKPLAPRSRQAEDVGTVEGVNVGFRAYPKTWWSLI